MKALYDLVDQVVRPYPRADEGPIEGLDTERHLIVEVIEQDLPEYNQATQRVQRSVTVDLQAETVTYGWQVIDDPLLALASARTQMSAIFDQMTTEDRAQFGTLRAGIESALNRSDIAAAHEMIVATVVPERLEATKAEILALFPTS